LEWRAEEEDYGDIMIEVTVQTVPSRTIAVVRRQVRIGEVGSAWKPALDQVWSFLRQNPGLRTDGHNIFLYHHPANRQLPMAVDFGVEVIREFEPAGEVRLARTPTGRVASAIHLGSYARMKETHDAIHIWAAAHNETFAGKSWEIYGDPQPDESKTEVRIEYLLA
jgi:effector-binding domain-containing protein